MSEVYYDRKGVKHFSAAARDAANLHYESEDRGNHYELRRQTQLAKDQLELTKENLHYGKQVAASQERQASALEQQAKDVQEHIQFQKDIAWLERSDSVGRFDFLLNRCRPQIEASLAEEVYSELKIARVPVRESFFLALRLASEAKNRLHAFPMTVEKTKAELDAARLATFKGSAGWWLVGYLVLVPALAVPIAVLLAHRAEPSLADLASCMFLALAATCPIGYKAIKTVRAQHRIRMAAASTQVQLMQRLAAIEQNQKELKGTLMAIGESVKAEYATWMSDARSQSIAVFKEVSGTTSIQSTKEIIAQEENIYPTTLRISWDQLGRTEICSKLDELASAVSEQVVSTHGPELLVAQLTFAGETQLADLVRSSFSPLFGLEWGLSEAEDEDDEEEEE